MSPDALETTIVCHLRCWRDGKAEKVTNTYPELLGEPSTSIEEWSAEHADAFRS